MSLQWTAVALFLYGEIAINLILCIPFISARRWRFFFNLKVWNWVTPYWNRCFFTMIMVLIILFADALREVNKYSGPIEPDQDGTVLTNLPDHRHMKLFRAQRNLYLSGFSLFLWLVMRRVVTLLNQVAQTLEDSAGLQVQINNAVNSAKQHQEDNLTLRQSLLNEETAMTSKNYLLKQEVEKLAGELKAAEDAMHKCSAEVEAMKTQAKGLAQEYDRLLTEHHQLQNLQTVEDKKDQ